MHKHKYVHKGTFWLTMMLLITAKDYYIMNSKLEVVISLGSQYI